MIRAPAGKLSISILLLSVVIIPLSISTAAAATSPLGDGGMPFSSLDSEPPEESVSLSDSDSVSRDGDLIVLNAAASSADGKQYDNGSVESGWKITQYETQWLWSGDPDTGKGISQPRVFGFNDIADWEKQRWQAAQDTDLVHPVPPHVIIKWNDQSWEEFSWDGRDHWIFDGVERQVAPPSRDKSMGPPDGNPVDHSSGDIRQAQTNVFAISPGTYYRTENGRELHIKPSGSVYVLSDFQTDLPLAQTTTDEGDLPENAIRRKQHNIITRTWVAEQSVKTGGGDKLAQQTHGINADGWPRRHDELSYDMNSDKYNSGNVDPEDVDELKVESDIRVQYVRMTSTTYRADRDDDGKKETWTEDSGDARTTSKTVTDTYDVEVNTVDSSDFEIISLKDHTTDEGTGRLGVFAEDSDVDWAGYRVPDANRTEEVLRSVPAYGEVTANRLAPRREVTTNWAFLTARDKNWDTLKVQEDVSGASEDADQEVKEFNSDSRPLYVHAFKGNRPKGASVGVQPGTPPDVLNVHYEPEEWGRDETPENFDYNMNDRFQDKRVSGITARHYVTNVSDTDIEIYGTVSGQETEIQSDDIKQRNRYESNLSMEVDRRTDESRIRLSLKNEQTGDPINLNPGNDRYDSPSNVEQQHGRILLRHTATDDVLGAFQPSDGEVAVTVRRTGSFTAIYEPAPWTSATTSFTSDRVRVAGTFPQAMELFSWMATTFIALLPVIYVLYKLKLFNKVLRQRI
jgi:hypothetical protein